ncbi:hypothetical protein BJ322DRAFT_1017246 [Thelephora terrestris]|uniref:DUF6532 domain-containing protein n=1 Tax=Thelephora terrestris TaxID=56493 RepID=A0A9P6LAU3_9AGAM|nr:hypothetical protein BJ322DRAFT_1017246 [Thelephora terrestris]
MAKSSYGLLGSDTEKAAKAATFLDQDAFHSGTTNKGAPDSTAPYQRQEVLFMLAYFFRCDSSLESQVPTGEHGGEIPKPMAALAATLIEVALREVVEGAQMQFFEKKQEDRYAGHLHSFEQVRVSKNGSQKLARALLNIYKGTIPLAQEQTIVQSIGGPDPGVLTKPSMMNTDLMPI